MRSRSSSSTENSIHSVVSSSVITNEELGISQSEGWFSTNLVPKQEGFVSAISIADQATLISRLPSF